MGFAGLRFGLGLFAILVIWLFGLVTVILRGLFDLVFLVVCVVFGVGRERFLALLVLLSGNSFV